ncbi:maltodextrin glucosidase [Bacteroides reticulotermitis JCM 10512]|uniref:Maltodextrin glucosidase n=1 Tax=Bacteroides reticulotermitis JCM 10512 TaxID=1445607 RepID=W4USB9_9BACE|nr:maltodextrin glucosidase [Bacteroides reticulotermitis JCM 10512]
MDWQQGIYDPKVKNLSNTWWINYSFFTQMEQHRETRPMLYHRWGGLGNHRYQVGFSGDAVVSWKSLDFQPYFNATASNVLYGYWSHDLGGHIGSKIDPEMYTRWLQFGALTPIMRTHSQKSAGLNKEPWVFNKEYGDILRKTIRQRYEMAPYIYTMARKGYDEGLSLCRPMYYDYPDSREAYDFRSEYMFGDDMLIAPATAPVKDGYLQMHVWLPEGEWYEWHTGTLLTGGQVVERPFAIDEYPIYVKAGAVLPLYTEKVMNLSGNDEDVVVTVFPGGKDSSSFTLYEDNGNDKKYASEYALTKLTSSRQGQEQTVVIGRREGQYADMPSSRSFKVKLLSSLVPQSVTVNGHPAKYVYSGEEFALVIDLPAMPCNQEKVVKVVYPTETVQLNGVLGVSNRIAKSMELLKYRDSYICFKEEFGKMGSLHEAVSYAPAELPTLLAEFWKSYNDLPEVLKRQGLNEANAKWFLQSVAGPPNKDVEHVSVWLGRKNANR